MKTKRRRVDF